MWDEAKQQQLSALQRKADDGSITSAEEQQLETLILDLEQAEWAALRPALERLRGAQADLQADLSQIKAQNTVVNALAARCEDLLARARLQLTGLARERDALRQVYEQTLENSVPS